MTVGEWIPIPGSIEAIARLKNAGYQVAVATNQSGLGRGYFNLDTLAAMHQKMADLLALHTPDPIDIIVYCPHRPEDNCSCRKPKSGLFDQIARELDTDLDNCWSIGDSLRDLQAGLKCAMQPVLVRTGKGAAAEQQESLPKGTLVFDDLSAAVDALLALGY